MSKFIKGMDLSTLLEMERCGAKYYDHGQEMDILDIMKKYDVDTIRLRLWNDPKSESGEPYGAGNNDLAETIAIGKRVTDAGLGYCLISITVISGLTRENRSSQRHGLPTVWKNWKKQYMISQKIPFKKYWMPA